MICSQGEVSFISQAEKVGDDADLDEIFVEQSAQARSCSLLRVLKGE